MHVGKKRDPKGFKGQVLGPYYSCGVNSNVDRLLHTITKSGWDIETAQIVFPTLSFPFHLIMILTICQVEFLLWFLSSTTQRKNRGRKPKIQSRKWPEIGWKGEKGNLSQKIKDITFTAEMKNTLFLPTEEEKRTRRGFFARSLWRVRGSSK